MTQLRRRLLALPLWERWGWLGVGLGLLVAATACPLLRRVAPQQAAEAAFWGDSDEGLDPWGGDYLTLELGATREDLSALTGQPWPPLGLAGTKLYTLGPNGADDGGFGDDVVVWEGDGATLEVTYSAGPNGVDERGHGDDVLVHVPRLQETSSLESWSRDLFALAQRPWPWLALAFLLAWVLRGPFVRRGRDARPGVELVRAAVLASGPLLVLAGLALWAGERLSSRGLSLRGLLAHRLFLLPAAWVIYGSLAGVCYLVALGWRLSRPPQAGDDC